MKVLGLVPARGGSKGVPRKNIRPLRGRPLLAYTAEQALKATRLASIVLSTEDEEIAGVGVQLGLRVPFLRPANLALDDTPTIAVVVDLLTRLADLGESYDAVCLLQPTCPMRTVEDIDGSIAMLIESGADTVVTVLPVPAEFNPHWVFERSGNGALRIATGEAIPVPRRQDLPPAFYRDGSVYVVRCETVMRGTLFGAQVRGYLTDGTYAVNIDEMSDWERAEALLAIRANT